MCCGHQNKRTGLVQVSNTSTKVCGCPCRQPCMQDCCCLSARTCNPSTLAQRLLGQMPPGPFSHALSIASTCKPSGRITLHQLEVVITCLCVPDGCEPTPGQRQHHTHTPGRGRDNNKPTGFTQMIATNKSDWRRMVVARLSDHQSLLQHSFYPDPPGSHHNGCVRAECVRGGVPDRTGQMMASGSLLSAR